MTTPMTTREVAQELVTLCRKGKLEEAVKALYHPEIVSVEATPNPKGERETRGLAAYAAKSEQFEREFEVHGVRAEGPFPHDERFAVFFQFDVTHRPTGQRMTLDEIAVYTVGGGKVVREEFFYVPMPDA